MKKKKALVLGATGLVGSHLLRALDTSSFFQSITAFTRKKSLNQSSDKISEVVIDYSRKESYVAFLNVDDIFCCLGTTMKQAKTKENFRQVDFGYPYEIARAGKKSGCKRFFLLTAIGSDKNSSVFYNKVKGEIEDAITELNFESTFIFRPSFLEGHRKETRAGETMGIGFMNLLKPISFGLLNKILPIKAEVVAQSMLQAAQSDLKGRHIFTSDVMQKGLFYEN